MVPIKERLKHVIKKFKNVSFYVIFYSLKHLESINFPKMGRKITTEIYTCAAWCGVCVLNLWNAKPNHYWEILIPKKGICGKFIKKWFKRSQMLRGFIKKNYRSMRFTSKKTSRTITISKLCFWNALRSISMTNWLTNWLNGD